MSNDTFTFGYTKKIYSRDTVVRAEIYDPLGRKVCWKWFYNGFDGNWIMRRYFKKAHKWSDDAINTLHELTL